MLRGVDATLANPGVVMPAVTEDMDRSAGVPSKDGVEAGWEGTQGTYRSLR